MLFRGLIVSGSDMFQTAKPKMSVPSKVSAFPINFDDVGIAYRLHRLAIKAAIQRIEEQADDIAVTKHRSGATGTLSDAVNRPAHS